MVGVWGMNTVASKSDDEISDVMSLMQCNIKEEGSIHVCEC